MTKALTVVGAIQDKRAALQDSFQDLIAEEPDDQAQPSAGLVDEVAEATKSGLFLESQLRATRVKEEDRMLRERGEEAKAIMQDLLTQWSRVEDQRKAKQTVEMHVDLMQAANPTDRLAGWREMMNAVALGNPAAWADIESCKSYESKASTAREVARSRVSGINGSETGGWSFPPKSPRWLLHAQR